MHLVQIVPSFKSLLVVPSAQNQFASISIHRFWVFSQSMTQSASSFRQGHFMSFTCFSISCNCSEAHYSTNTLAFLKLNKRLIAKLLLLKHYLHAFFNSSSMSICISVCATSSINLSFPIICPRRMPKQINKAQLHPVMNTHMHSLNIQCEVERFPYVWSSMKKASFEFWYRKR